MPCKEKMLMNAMTLSITWGIGVVSLLMVISCVQLTLSAHVSHPLWCAHRNTAFCLFSQILGSDVPMAVAVRDIQSWGHHEHYPVSITTRLPVHLIVTLSRPFPLVAA